MNPLTIEWITKAEGDFATAPKTHGLVELLALIIEFDPVYLRLQPDLNVI